MIAQAVATSAPPAPSIWPKPPTPALYDHLSWSSVKTYSSCPKQFQYKYVSKAPAEFVPASLAFGSSFHAAVDQVHQNLLEGAALPTGEALLKKFDESWKQETARTPQVQFGKTEDAASLRELARRMLAAYLEFAAASGMGRDGAKIIAIEHAHRFKLLAGAPPIETRLDLLELSGSDLIVSDIKTARSRWNDQKTAESILQLVLYASAIAPLLKELGAKRVVPRFLVVTKAKTPAIQVLEPQAAQADVDRLKRQVADTWAAIQAGVFASSDILPVLQEYETPSHPEFAERNGWSLYNAATSRMKTQSPGRQAEGFKSLNAVMVSQFN